MFHHCTDSNQPCVGPSLNSFPCLCLSALSCSYLYYCTHTHILVYVNTNHKKVLLNVGFVDKKKNIKCDQTSQLRAMKDDMFHLQLFGLIINITAD